MNTPRKAVSTVTFIDNYCSVYRDLFSDVRSFEAFKFLHLGMISEISRKSLPAIARAVGLRNDQGLHHVLTESPWRVSELRERRLRLILQQLNGQAITLVIDETGDRKKGKTTDYVDRQYIGNLGKVDNGMVSVNAYGVLEQLTFPLSFKIFKPKARLKPTDIYVLAHPTRLSNMGCFPLGSRSRLSSAVKPNSNESASMASRNECSFLSPAKRRSGSIML